jgi:hypothetical protein
MPGGECVAEARWVADDVPPPKRGGTWLYCPWAETGPGYRAGCGQGNRRRTGARFATLAAYRRHWRRAHR